LTPLVSYNRIGEVMADDKLRATPAARKLAD